MRSRDTKRRPRRNLALAALLLLDTVPLARPFSSIGGFNRNSLQRLWTPQRAPPPQQQQQSSPLFSAADGGDGSDHGDVITGSNQLEGWKTNTVGAAGAPGRRSNVMGRRAPDGIDDGTGDGGSSSNRDMAGPAPPPPPLLERDGGGVVHGGGYAGEGAGGEEAPSPTWRSEAATTSAELLVSLKV